jgi:hypothetical protein
MHDEEEHEIDEQRKPLGEAELEAHRARYALDRKKQQDKIPTTSRAPSSVVRAHKGWKRRGAKNTILRAEAKYEKIAISELTVSFVDLSQGCGLISLQLRDSALRHRFSLGGAAELSLLCECRRRERNERPGNHQFTYHKNLPLLVSRIAHLLTVSTVIRSGARDSAAMTDGKFPLRRCA